MRNKRLATTAFLAFLSGLAVLTVALPLATRAAPLPPPPELPATPTAAPPTTVPNAQQNPLEGAAITLKVQFPSEWAELGMDWQDLVTQVQWQDDKGRWHDVTSWRGALDNVQAAYGYKTWWGGKDDLGTGPFRWLIFAQAKGRLLATSEFFTLPEVRGGAQVVEVELMP